MTALEIWTNVSGGVMLRDSTTGQSREMKEVKAVIFVDDSVFPVSSNECATSETTVRTLSGRSLKSGSGYRDGA